MQGPDGRGDGNAIPLSAELNAPSITVSYRNNWNIAFNLGVPGKMSIEAGSFLELWPCRTEAGPIDWCWLQISAVYAEQQSV